MDAARTHGCCLLLHTDTEADARQVLARVGRAYRRAMKIGLVGMPGAGKTTVFDALTGLSAETGLSAARGKTNLGVVKVPDPRVDALAELFRPKKKTDAEITFSDVAAGLGAGAAHRIDRKMLDGMREVDALCQVIRAFDDLSQGSPADPLREIRDLEAELILADLELVEKRLERMKKEKGHPGEEAALHRFQAQLEASQPLRSLHLPEDEWALFTSLRFLSLKHIRARHRISQQYRRYLHIRRQSPRRHLRPSL
jgi:ribosome-binding ATPase YchF (GTP1/OBG family)